MPASKSAKPVQPASKAVAKTEKKAPSVSAPKSKATLFDNSSTAVSGFNLRGKVAAHGAELARFAVQSQALRARVARRL